MAAAAAVAVEKRAAPVGVAAVGVAAVGGAAVGVAAVGKGGGGGFGKLELEPWLCFMFVLYKRFRMPNSCQIQDNSK